MDLHHLNFKIEIETVNRTRERVAQAIQSVVGGEVRHVATPICYDPWAVTDERGREWSVVADGSLTNVAAHLRAEVVSPVLSYWDIPQLQAVIRALRACGATVDERCGIHVHVDSGAFDGRTLANLAKLVYKQEPLLLTALGVQQARLERYTQPVDPQFIARIEQQKPRTKDELNPLWYGQENLNPIHYDQSRYHGVNLHNVWYRGTVEFRWFEGTLHAGKVKAYIQFVLALAAKALNGRAASSRKREFNAASARYDFRVFLLHLGLIGEEYKTARKHLLAAMPGDAAFKHGRPAAQEVQTVAA